MYLKAHIFAPINKNHGFDVDVPTTQFGSEDPNPGSNEIQYIGVRKRRWERYVAEIKDPGKKTRIWLGTFDSAEEAARAYDTAAREVCGANAKTNFPAPIEHQLQRPSGSKRILQMQQQLMDTSTITSPGPPLPSSSATATSSSSSIEDEIYDVFLSFSSEDTHKTFTDHLYWTLKDARIDALIEEEKSSRKLKNLDEITRKLKNRCILSASCQCTKRHLTADVIILAFQQLNCTPKLIATLSPVCKCFDDLCGTNFSEQEHQR